jgi:hypothetical protein
MRSFTAVDELTDLDHEFADGAEGARRMAWRSMNAEPDLNQVQPSPRGGVKWTWILGLAASQVRIAMRL